MKRPGIFAGTTEGRKLSQYCESLKLSYVCFTATSQGTQELSGIQYGTVHEGRLNRKEMKEQFVSEQLSVIFDATHPYAREVSGNIEAACQALCLPYIRVLREQEAFLEQEEEFFHEFDSLKEIVKQLKYGKERILLTTGSKEASLFAELNDFSKRVWLRMLPDEEMKKKMEAAGMLPDHIICGKGPFSEEENRQVLEEHSIDVLVTKEAGRAGGFPEKLKAAKKWGCQVYCVSRPKETGISLSEAEKQLTDILEKEGK